MIVVSDTSAISALLTVGKLPLLHQNYGEILIPDAVWKELYSFHPDMSHFGFLNQCSVKNLNAVEPLLESLDRGEAEAIILAVEKKADVLLIDESLGRFHAMKHDVPIIGLMGVLLLAKSKGLVHEIGPIIQDVEEMAGFYLGRALKSQILREAGEG